MNPGKLKHFFSPENGSKGSQSSHEP